MSTDSFSYATEKLSKFDNYENAICIHCNYFHPHYRSSKEQKNSKVGSCHRYPPKNFIINDHIKTVFPVMPQDTFACGEFRRKFK